MRSNSWQLLQYGKLYGGMYRARAVAKRKSRRKKKNPKSNRVHRSGKLGEFWREILTLNKQERINLLKQYSEFRVPTKQPYNARREAFEELKTQRHLSLNGKDCLVCCRPAEIRHHILQVQHGGGNKKQNICFLCVSCHAEVHPWLKD